MKPPDENNPPHSGGGSWIRRVFLAVAILATLAVLFFRGQISDRVADYTVLIRDAPSEEVLKHSILSSPDPQARLLAVWNRGKVLPRELALNFVATIAPIERPCPRDLEIMLMSGALDPDENIREAALGQLRSRHDPALPALAAAQLTDADPRIRMLGLQYLRDMPAKVGVPLGAPLLDDHNPLVVGEAINLIDKLSGEDFGVKVRDILPLSDGITAEEEIRPEHAARARAGVERAKAWVAKHRDEFDWIRPAIPAEALAALRPIRAGDFTLPSLNGRSVRLSDFRGKVVLLNFWTTWCPECIWEMPELAELQKRIGDHVAILGTSLDFIPDEDDQQKPGPPQEIRAKVARVVRQRGINYTVLLDEKGDVGMRFNGGELPTTVIIDAAGYVRRRFVGLRSIPVLNAFIAAASKPVDSSLTGAVR